MWSWKRFIPLTLLSISILFIADYVAQWNSDQLHETNPYKVNDTGVVEYDYRSLVVRVIDGDTLDLESGDRVRLSIVNTPERGEDGYGAATEFTRELCLGKKALINLDEGQGLTFGRVVASVYCDGRNLNQELIDYGYGVKDYRFCGQTEFKDLCFNNK